MILAHQKRQATCGPQLARTGDVFSGGESSSRSSALRIDLDLAHGAVSLAHGIDIVGEPPGLPGR